MEKKLITGSPNSSKNKGNNTVELWCSDCGEITHYPERICPTLKEERIPGVYYPEDGDGGG